MSLEHHGMIGGPLSGPPPEQVICEPVPVLASGILPCRRGQGQRTFQGQKPPTCDGIVKPKAVGHLKMLACEKCGLVHATVNKDGVLHYGPVL
jgi:hypothetical protein